MVNVDEGSALGSCRTVTPTQAKQLKTSIDKLEADIPIPSLVLPESRAQHSAASPEWGTPLLVQELAALVLAPSSINVSQKHPIDLDVQSSAYWQTQWSEATRPASYFDGSSPTHDAFNAPAWTSHRNLFSAATKQGMAVFCNPAGGQGGERVQRSFEILHGMHADGCVSSAFWVGFSLEQFASLQAAGGGDPLDPAMATIIPSRRVRYRTHPDRALAETIKRLDICPSGKKWSMLAKRRDAIVSHIQGHGDKAIDGDAPTHASYFTIMWSALAKVRAKQQSALRRFLSEQSKIKGSLFERARVVGAI